MKKTLLLGTVIILTLISCESLFNDSSDQILFKTDSGLEYKYSDFQLYDSSTHIFYFKSNHPEFKTENSLTFSLLANGEEIFQGVFWGIISSALPYGPFIYSYSFYQDYAFRIDFIKIDNQPPDTRNDPRLIEALKDQNLLHSGLSASINSIEINGSLLTFKFSVINKDESNLLILDPDKMGINLFHYYTNEPILFNISESKVYNCSVDHQKPPYSDYWSIDWLSELKPGDSRQFTLNFSLLSTLIPGVYRVSYEFPGLTHQISNDQLYQNDKRIWLGDVNIISTITVK